MTPDSPTPKAGLEMHVPKVLTDGGPWADHDMPCAICQTTKAVLDLDIGVYRPCWACQKRGFDLRWKRRRLDRRVMARFRSYFATFVRGTDDR